MLEVAERDGAQENSQRGCKGGSGSLGSAVERVYVDPPSLLWKFPAVRDIALSTRLFQSSSWLVAWLRHLEQQIAITPLEHIRDRARFGSSQRFLWKRDVFNG